MSISFDRVAEAFDRTRRIPRGIMGKIVETLKEELEDYKLILDVAVGTGRFAKPLEEASIDVIGVDISRKMLKKAYGKKFSNLVLCDACDLPFEKSTFDASISVSTLHLIKDWKLALREITRVTRESLFTVLRPPVDYERTPSYIYRELLKKYGYSHNHLGIGLWKLKEMIKPSKSRFVTSYDVNTNERLTFLDERVFSFQWNVPDDLHDEAMQELRRIFPENEQLIVGVYVYKWDITEIKKWLEC